MRGSTSRHTSSAHRSRRVQRLDLREPGNCAAALTVAGGFDEVYQLAADMGGMGFIHSAECEIMHNSILINVHMITTAAEMGVPATSSRRRCAFTGTCSPASRR